MRPNAGSPEIPADSPFVVSLSNHEKDFFSILLEDRYGDFQSDQERAKGTVRRFSAFTGEEVPRQNGIFLDLEADDCHVSWLSRSRSLVFGGNWPWFKRAFFPRYSNDKYSLKIAWWLENLISVLFPAFLWGVAYGLAFAGLTFVPYNLLPEGTEPLIRLFNTTTWFTFFGLHLANLFGRRAAAPLSLTLPFSISAINISAGLFLSLPPPLLIPSLFITGFGSHWLANGIAYAVKGALDRRIETVADRVAKELLGEITFPVEPPKSPAPAAESPAASTQPIDTIQSGAVTKPADTAKPGWASGYGKRTPTKRSGPKGPAREVSSMWESIKHLLIEEPEEKLSAYQRAVNSEFLREGAPYKDFIKKSAQMSTVHEYKQILALLYTEAGDLRGKSVLEIGSRAGVVAETLKRLGGVDAAGIEGEEIFVEFAKKRGVAVYLGTYLSVPEELKVKTFDVTFSYNFMSLQLSQKERLKILNAIANVTRTGGLSIHKTRNKMEFTDEEIRAAGFEIRKKNPERTFFVLEKIERPPLDLAGFWWLAILGQAVEILRSVSNGFSGISA